MLCHGYVIRVVIGFGFVWTLGLGGDEGGPSLAVDVFGTVVVVWTEGILGDLHGHVVTFVFGVECFGVLVPIVDCAVVML